MSKRTKAAYWELTPEHWGTLKALIREKGLESRDMFMLRLLLALTGRDFAYKSQDLFAEGCHTIFLPGTDIGTLFAKSHIAS